MTRTACDRDGYWTRDYLYKSKAKRTRQFHLTRSLNMLPNCIYSAICCILLLCCHLSPWCVIRCDALSFLNSNGQRSSYNTVARLKLSTCVIQEKTTFVGNRFSTQPSFCHWNSATEREVFQTSTLLMMGKGDGKKKRKKKSSNGTSTPAPMKPVANSPPPQRVTSDSNISVRRQIQWARMKKEINNSGSSFRQLNVKRTAYRKSLDEQEMEEAKIQRAKRGQEPDWDVILNATASSPLVIVDAYNIIHKWPRLKKWMTRGMISKARDMLIHDMEELRALKGWRIEIVFDGFGRTVNGPLGDGPGSKMIRERISKSDQQASKDVTTNGVRVVYSGAGTSADGYIEKRCFDAKQVTDGKLTGSLIVASDDNMIRNVACNAGALCMSADRMVDELKALRKATMYRVEVAVAKVNGHDVRPAKLLGKPLPNMFVRGSQNVIIEDKRNKTRKVQKKDETEHSKTLEDLRKGTTSIPSWAVVPPKNNNI